MTDQVLTRMTATEYFERPETNRPEELIEGELVLSPPPIPDHQRSVAHLYTLVDGLKPDGEVFFAPIAVYLDDDNVPEPDVVWVAANSQCVIGDKRLEGPPDLVIEVFSPGSVRRDRRDKFELFQRFGVREYWMVDPTERYIEVYRREHDRFVRQGVYGPEDTFTSTVLSGKTVDVKAVFPA